MISASASVPPTCLSQVPFSAWRFPPGGKRLSLAASSGAGATAVATSGMFFRAFRFGASDAMASAFLFLAAACAGWIPPNLPATFP